MCKPFETAYFQLNLFNLGEKVLWRLTCTKNLYDILIKVTSTDYARPPDTM